jgi:hypothetical protein
MFQEPVRARLARLGWPQALAAIHDEHLASDVVSLDQKADRVGYVLGCAPTPLERAVGYPVDLFLAVIWRGQDRAWGHGIDTHFWR